MDTSQFISALLAIIVIDLVLAGDNAIVIALAARGLPAHLQKRAILWGAVGAIGVRCAMTVIVVWLLKIPGLLLAGGALLVWIAWKLMMPEEGEADGHGPVATTFWGAMRTVIIADAVMGLDNVLAVAGAAHGSYLLVVLGLAISVPVVVWGSSLVLKVVERFPIVVYLGAGVLLWTAVKMMSSEPLIAPWLAQWPVIKLLAWLLVPGLLWAAALINHRVRATRIHSRLAVHQQKRPAAGAAAQADERPALNVLVPVDGSANALAAVRHAMGEYRQNHALRVQLLNVQTALSRHAARFLSTGDRDDWHAQRAEAAMAEATALLREAGVPCDTHWCVGGRAEEICSAATRLGVHHIVMGTARKSSLTRMLEDSVTNQVLEATPVPVEVISGPAVSRLERWGLPTGLLGLAGLLWLALR